jgi:hypothetical protein
LCSVLNSDLCHRQLSQAENYWLEMASINRPGSESLLRSAEEPAMENDFIRVTRRRDGAWAVFRGSRGLVLLAFRLKTHAVAYARAVSFSGQLRLFVDDKCGIAVRQSSASLTYPRLLD